MTLKKNVTIVVPVYGDLPSLSQCIESLKKYTSSNHRVLLVNDCGPEKEIIEAEILKRIKGLSHFEYQSNPENLGFIGTCNRAVFELDKTSNDILLLNSDTVVTEGYLEEMLEVLYLNEHHGAVCPRSSNATIASVPFRFQTPLDDRETEYAWSVYEKIKPLMQRYTVAPVAVGFCMLIRRELIKNYGLFDPQYGLGYSEENDFCQRINQYGYSSIIANQAFVYHLESKSFTSEKKRILVEANEQKMLKRYPYYTDLVQRYISSYIDPVDWFADTIAQVNENKKVLINLFHLPTSFNGTSRNALSFLMYLKRVSKKLKNTEFVILAQKDASHYHNLEQFGFRVLNPDKEINETFHVGYVPSQVFHLKNLILMNRYCLKVIVSDLDIIGVRSNYLLANSFDIRSLYLDSFRFADGVVSISQATADDTLAYYSGEGHINTNRIKVIPQGFPGNTFSDNTSYANETSLVDASILSGEYILLVGNRYKHKALEETINALQGKVKLPIVVFGKKFTNREGVYGIESGGVSDQFIEKLTKSAKILLFPSTYEGFGLPIAEAAKYNVPLILADTKVSREVASIYKGLEVRYYSNFGDIAELVNDLLASKSQKKESSMASVRTLDDYNAEVLDYIFDIIKEPIDVERLRERWIYFTHIAEYVSDAPAGTGHNLRVRVTSYVREKSPRAYMKARDLYRTYIKR